MTRNEQLDRIEEIAKRLRRVMGEMKQLMASLDKRLEELVEISPPRPRSSDQPEEPGP